MRKVSASKWFYFGINTCIQFTLALLFSATAFSSQAVKTTASTTSGHWKNVTFVYPQQMMISSDNPPLPHSCIVIRRPEQGQTAVQCQAQVKLVRPAFLVTRWQQEQARDGYFIFSEPELGAVNVSAEITEVAHGVNPTSITPANPWAKPVTGIFIKYATDVRQYIFRDEVTGRLSKINATPNHPFYVTNAQQYKAVGDLSQKDHLINVYGHSIALVCPAGKTHHCGRPWHAGKIIPVYNLEVYQQHRYFVGSVQILVHNVYKCKVCGEEFIDTEDFTTHIRSSHLDHVRGKYQSGCFSSQCGCEFCQLGSDIIRTHATGKYKCLNCQDEFSTFSEFKNHKRTVHRNNKSFQCPECDLVIYERAGIEKHIKILHPNSADTHLEKLRSSDPDTSWYDHTPARERASARRDRSRSPKM